MKARVITADSLLLTWITGGKPLAAVVNNRGQRIV